MTSHGGAGGRGRVYRIGPYDDLLTSLGFERHHPSGMYRMTQGGDQLIVWEYSDGRLLLFNATKGLRFIEFGVASYREVNRGTQGVFQGHHAIQDSWAYQMLSSHGYNSNNAPVIILLEAGGSSPHGVISSRQRHRFYGGAEDITIGNRTYIMERRRMQADIRAAGVPPEQIVEARTSVDEYFRGLWSGISNESLRREKFGDVRGRLGWT